MPASASPYRVDITRRCLPHAISDERLRQAACATLRAEGMAFAEISLLLTGDDEIHQINRQWLKHDYPTDVISFSLGDAESTEKQPAETRRIEGELIISLETAQRVAAEEGCSLEAEVVLYLVHGLLHLCGYDDGTEFDRTIMRKRERDILSQLHLLPDGDSSPARGEDVPA
jgi:probable rRNA maturation factor